MNPYGHLPRSMPRPEWAEFYAEIRRIGIAHQWEGDDPLARRAELAEIVAKAAHGGNVQLAESGMDCDCCRYVTASLVPALPRLVEREIDTRFEWAEGPCHVSVVSPLERIEPESEDLALRAFEDGHPHCVYV